MIHKVIVFILLFWTGDLVAQHSFFLDSLFGNDLSKLESIHLNDQLSELNLLQHDYGLSGGVTITNNSLEQLDEGLSTRVFAKMDLWKGGYYSNQNQSEVIFQQMKLDSIKGYDRALDFNYGLYFNYVIYLFNQERVKIIDRIIEDNENVSKYLKDLYYNKLINYSDLLSMESSRGEYDILRESLVDYNILVDTMLSDSDLPLIDPSLVYEVDFKGLCALVSNNPSSQEIIDVEHEILELQSENFRSPYLSATMGYDVSRHRSFFAVNLRVDIQTNKKDHLKAKKVAVVNNLEVEEVQKKKELINIQYEYRYKEKQLRNLYAKKRMMEETRHTFEVRKEVLSLEESIQEQKLKVDQQKVEYEIADLKGQLMLDLLRVKRLFPKTEIACFIKNKNHLNQHKKYAGRRFVIMDDTFSLSKFDSLYLKQNELNAVASLSALVMDSTLFIDPSIYETRMDMEKDILFQMGDDTEMNIIILDLEDLKALELKTISQQQFAISTVKQ